MSKTSPVILCRKVQSVNLDDWSALGALFRDADFALFQQSWLAQPAPWFRPAMAAMVWTADSLVVYAELCDDDIHNTIPADDFNRMAIEFGDVFEIFLKPAGQESYFEFHVAPNNHKLQLRFPCLEPFKKLKDTFNTPEELFDSFKIWKPVVESRVRIDAAAKKWWVAVRIPLAMLVEAAPPAPGVRWLFSCCRYDYTRPGSEPVHSSTSPHSALNFHLVHEYGTMEFA